MLHSQFSRSRTWKLALVIVVLVLLTTLLFISDSIIAKIHAQHLPATCVLCQLNEPVTFSNSTRVIHFNLYATTYSQRNVINVVVFFAHVDRNPNLKSKFMLCMSSLFKHAKSPLHLHILTDELSLSTSTEILQKTVPLTNTSVEVIVFLIKRPLISEILYLFTGFD